MPYRTCRLVLSSLAGAFIAAGCNEPLMPLEQLDLAVGERSASPRDMASGGVDLPRIGGDLAANLEGPIVVIVAPLKDERLIGKQVRVTATAKPGTKGDVVKSIVLNGSRPGVEPIAMSLVSSGGGVGTYEALLDIVAYPSGVIELLVTAEDVAGRLGRALVTCLRDRGPVITVVSPKSKPPLRGSAPLAFVVSDPEGIDLASVEARVQNARLMLVNKDMGDTWTGEIKFNAPEFQNGLVSGPNLVHLSAKNKAGTLAEIDAPFTVDESGPKIAIMSPVGGGFVGGVINIVAEITDELSDVSDNSVVVVIPDVEQGGMNKGKMVDRRLPMMRDNAGMMSSNRFIARFDTRTLHPNYYQSLLTFHAADALGNEATSTVQVFVDNTPPAISLDPPKTRVFKKMDGKIICSAPFDPLGDECANDGDLLPQVAWVKAKIEDRGNAALGQAYTVVSLISAPTVKLYFMPVDRRAPVPLVVDTNGDGICDDLNPELQPSPQANKPKQAVVSNLVPLSPTGVADFRSVKMPAHPACSVYGEDGAKPPDPICDADGESYYPYYTGAKEPSTYTIPPIEANKVGCNGKQFDFLNRIPDGEICVAVVAEDRAGNRAVAKPIRLCLDKLRDPNNPNPNPPCDDQVYRERDTSRPFGYVRPNQGLDLAKLPDCTGTAMVNNGKLVVTNTPCRPVVKLNTGLEEAPFSPNDGLYEQ